MPIDLSAVGPTLPIHPRTGLTALGFRRNGDPIWPVRGASPDDPGETAETEGESADDPDGADRLGDAGKQAIDRMKGERNAARKELRDAQARLAAFEKAEQERADRDRSEAEKRAAAEQRAVEAELRATRLEVAHEKGLTPAQAKRLVGSTREALEADADEILRDFPVPPVKPEPKGPKPDPSQGARSTSPTASVEAGASLYQQKHAKKTSV